MWALKDMFFLLTRFLLLQFSIATSRMCKWPTIIGLNVCAGWMCEPNIYYSTEYSIGYMAEQRHTSCVAQIFTKLANIDSRKRKTQTVSMQQKAMSCR